MKWFLIFYIVFLIAPFTNAQTEYKKIHYCKDGVIAIPSSWTIHDDEWNEEITKSAGYSNSKKRTILRANDYKNSTMYIKLSTKELEEAIPDDEIKSLNFLSLLNEDLNSIIKSISNNQSKKLVESKSAITEKFGNAIGGSISYTYSDNEGNQRKTLIYTMVRAKNFYNLTISWNASKQANCQRILDRLKSEIIFSN